jgi:glycosyltransferase involved in cell wall biosynthesis
MNLSTTSNSSNRFVVVTPNYNMGEYLEATIESVLGNLREGDEYFVIDGGSTDGSINVIKKYANRLTGWVSERDAGYADAINKGFSLGTAQYQCWINCGDLLLEGALDLARDLIEESGVDMIFGDDCYIDENNRVIGYSRGICKDLRVAMLYGDWTPLQDACFWKSELYRRVGGLDPNLKSAADYALFANFAVAGKTCYMPYAFSAFRRHQGQKSIANKVSYKTEKSRVRRTLVAACSDSLLMKLRLRIVNFVAIRWRARVMHRIWDIPGLHGRAVCELIAGISWPKGKNLRIARHK